MKLFKKRINKIAFFFGATVCLIVKIGIYLKSKPNLEEFTPTVVVVEVEGFQTFAGKMTDPQTLDLLGQTWKASLPPPNSRSNPTIVVMDVEHQVHHLDDSHLKLIPTGKASLAHRITHASQAKPLKYKEIKDSGKTLLNKVGIKIIDLPGGTYSMGSPQTEFGRDRDEIQHPVSLSPFRTTSTHLTRKQWEELTGKGLSFPAIATEEEIQTWDQCPQCPMTFISWYEVQDAIRILRNKGISARFLTEAEAEYLSRLDTPIGKVSESAYPWGENSKPLANNAWFNLNSNGKPHPVQLKDATYSGKLYDVRGGVFTWTEDKYAPYKIPVDLLPLKDPKNTQGPDDSPRVVKGGGWGSDSRALRSAFRSFWRPQDSSHLIGIRLAFD